MTTTTAKLTRAEDAYAHLASFQRGDEVDVRARTFLGYVHKTGTVTTAQRDDADGIEHAFLVVEGCDAVSIITVASLLSRACTITSLDDAKAGNVRYFDAAGYAQQSPEDAADADAIIARMKLFPGRGDDEDPFGPEG